MFSIRSRCDFYSSPGISALHFLHRKGLGLKYISWKTREQIERKILLLPIQLIITGLSRTWTIIGSPICLQAVSPHAELSSSPHTQPPRVGPQAMPPRLAGNQYTSVLGDENIKKVDSILEAERTIDGKKAKSQRDKGTTTRESPKNEPATCHVITKIRPKSEPLDQSIAKFP
jgi:hypothetical protein